MSSTSYIYSTSRVGTLQSQLLSVAQTERMVSANSAAEAFGALNDTFLAPYIAGGELIDLPRALRKSLSAAKRLIVSIAPEQSILQVLWLRYDFYNLGIIIKGLRAGLTDEQLQEYCLFTGSVDITKMITALRTETTRDIDTPTIRFSDTVAIAEEATTVYDIDRIVNRAYFVAIGDIAAKSKYKFIREYVSLLIDMYNVRTQLRLVQVAQFAETERVELWIDGGSMRLDDCVSADAIIAQLERISGVSPMTAVWKGAVEAIISEQNFAILERATDDFVGEYVKKADATILSPAPLFAYFLAHRNNTQIIKTIIAGKESGMSQTDLRKILRRLYT